MVDEPGVRFGLASGALALTMLVVSALPLGLGGSATVALIATAALGTTMPRIYAAGLAVQTWAYFTGFFLHQYGVLTFSALDVRNLFGFVIGTVVLGLVFKAPTMAETGGVRR
jgi:hypothetical protein